MAGCSWKSARPAEHTVDIAQTLLELDPRPDWLARSSLFLLPDDYEWSFLTLQTLAGTVHENVIPLPQSAYGVALSLLALSRPKLAINFPEFWPWKLREEDVDAFFRALASSRSPVVTLQLVTDTATFGTARSAARLGQCLNANSTLQQLQIFLEHPVKPWWAAFSNSLTGNSTLRTLLVAEQESWIGKDLAATISRFSVLTDLQLLLARDRDVKGIRQLLIPFLTDPASALTSLTVADCSVGLTLAEAVVLVTAEALLQNPSTKLETLAIELRIPTLPPDTPRPKLPLRLSSPVCEKVAQMLGSNSSLKFLPYDAELEFNESAVLDAMSSNHRFAPGEAVHAPGSSWCNSFVPPAHPGLQCQRRAIAAAGAVRTVLQRGCASLGSDARSE